jgi:uncharacterized Zn-binding protein involved in type VI secretion
MHTCPMVIPGTPPIPHVGGPILPPCAPTVMIGFMAAAKVGDKAICTGGGIPDPIVKGSMSVQINSMPAARIGDSTAHGGLITVGCPTVIIGDGMNFGGGGGGMAQGGSGGSTKSLSPLASGEAMTAPEIQKKALTDAAKSGAPFCEICEQLGQSPLVHRKPPMTPIAPPKPEDVSAFGKSFEQKTGMKLSDSLKAYKADTGKDLDPKTVETLFTDSEKAKKLLMEDKSLHTRYRDILNSNAPATEEEAKKQGYKKLSTLKSWYHNPWYNKWQNSKYVSADGHREAVFDDRGVLVNSNDYKGTFNFFGPKGLTDSGDHINADVDPYKKWGN